MTLLITSSHWSHASKPLHFPLTLAPVITVTQTQTHRDFMYLRRSTPFRTPWLPESAALQACLPPSQPIPGLQVTKPWSREALHVPCSSGCQESPISWILNPPGTARSAHAESLPSRMLEEFVERIFWHQRVKVETVITRTSVPEWKAYPLHTRPHACTVQQAGCRDGRECPGSED